MKNIDNVNTERVVLNCTTPEELRNEQRYKIKTNIYNLTREITHERIRVIKCTTPEECEALINCYITHFNKEDIPFRQDMHYDFPGDMCIELDNENWTYADSSYYEAKNAIIVPFAEIDLEVKTRGFEVCHKRKTDKSVEITLPTRGTSKAMAYDFYSPISAVVQPGEIVKIWTDVKSYMKDTECLILNVRSSMGGKFMLANTLGWIDADYYNNENNEGNIGFFLKNISEAPQTIEIGDRIGQGAFFNFLVSDNGNPEEEVVRTGGFGSSGK